MPFTAVLTLPDGRRHLATLPDSGGWAVLADPQQPSETSLGWHLYALPDGSHVHRFSNGVVPHFCGALYFRDLAVTHDALSIEPMRPDLARSGKWLAIVAAPLGGAIDHLWRPRQQRRVRCALHDGTPAGLRHAVDVLRYRTAVISDPVRDYGATRSRLPRVNRAQLAAVRQLTVRQVLAGLVGGIGAAQCSTGDGLFAAQAIGPWWRNGTDSGAEYGGRMINPTLDASDAQCAEGLFLRSIAHELQTDRACEAMHDRATGKPVSVYDAKATQSLLTDASQPERWRVELDPFLEGPYDARRYVRFNAGHCPYEAAWWAVEKVDPAHGCRALECAVALAELAGDESARDDVWMLAESWRQIGWSDRADELVASRQPPGAWIPPSLTAKIDALQVTGPNRGSTYLNREFAWVASAGRLAAKYGRGEWGAWIGKMSWFSTAAVDPLGLCGRDYDQAGMPAGVRGVMSFHEALVLCARFSLGAAEVPAWGLTLRATALALTSPAVRKEYSNEDGHKGDGTFGPAHWLWSEVRGVTLPQLDRRHSRGPGDPAHELAACALAYRATGDLTLLERSLAMWVPHASLKERLAWLRSLSPMKGWGAELESVLEDLEAKGEL